MNGNGGILIKECREMNWVRVRNPDINVLIYVPRSHLRQLYACLCRVSWYFVTNTFGLTANRITRNPGIE
jgi:hypothetical protein